eukprot:CAMPEP_0184484682 /NCGR_PEP_ID=MMETSP0113_2-20130426/6371_1 /TAXON_ID=91329 /ORGANISM="Norrisiella sphaerica, Strain BC52" /LENGTH=662 /DNA_ID=CAMNT_0026865777 /DNA_START=554 /DNA_END=2542 /DNA_ORIENTATION=+
MFDNLITTVQDAEDFFCAGQNDEDLRAGSSLEELKANYGGTAGMLARCTGNSLGEFLYGAQVKVNDTFGTVDSAIDQMKEIITAVNNTIAKVDNSTELTLTINSTLYTLKNQSIFIATNILSINSTGSFVGYLPNPYGVPLPNAVDAGAVITTKSGLDTARSRLVELRNTLSPTIMHDLDVTTRQSSSKSRGDITVAIISVGNSLLKSLSDYVSYESDIEDMRDTATSSESFGQYVMAAVYSTTVICLIVMLLGYLMKKRWPMCCGAYFIFGLFMWLAFVLGIFLLLSMLVYDLCGCEGTYTTAGCINIRTMIRVNMDSNFTVNDKSVNIGKKVEQIISCPVSETSSGDYIYTPESNFIDIFDIGQTFNYTDKVNSTVVELQNAAANLNASAATSAINQVETAKTAMAYVEVGTTYNFTQDGSQYRYLSQQLANPGNDPTYYPTPQPASVKLQNRVYLSELDTVNTEMEVERDNLLTYKVEFNASVDNIVTAIRTINSTVENAKIGLNNITVKIEELVDYITTINQYTPCGFIGTAYSNLVVGDFCENTFSILDGTSAGGIVSMVATLLGFFLIAMMRDCVLMHHEEQVSTMEPGEAADAKAIDVTENMEVGQLTNVGPKSPGSPGSPIMEGMPTSPTPLMMKPKVMASPVGETTDGGKAPI